MTSASQMVTVVGVVSMDRVFFIVGSALAGLSVGAGAFGAHLLRQRLEPQLMAAFETAARYQMYHGLALLAVAWAVGRWPGAGLEPGGWMLLGGTIVFSGSLYAMSLGASRMLGAVTPLGGTCLIIGWIWLIVSAARAGS